MFKLIDEPVKVTWPVVIKTPGDDGAVITSEAKFIFSVPQTTGPNSPFASQKLADFVVGWEEITYNGDALAVTPENTEKLLSNPWVFQAVDAALAAILRGDFERKN